MKLRDLPFCALLVLVALLMPVLNAQDGLPGLVSRSTQVGRSTPDFGLPIAAADFDSDQKADGAILLETGRLNGMRSFRIELHLTADQNKDITFSSAQGGLAIWALDINHDGAPDIVVENILTHQCLRVYLNDGHGTFHKARIEDYPSSDPAPTSWKTRLTENLPAFCFPSTREFETAILQLVRMLGQDACGRLRIWPTSYLAPSGARDSSSSRAPPTFLFL